MASLPGWFETADVSNYAQSLTISNTSLAIFVPISLDEAPNNPTCTEIRLRSNTVGGNYKLAIYNDNGSGAPGALVQGSNTAITGVGTDSFFGLAISQTLAQGTYWIGVKGDNGGAAQPNLKADITSPPPTGHTEPVARFGTASWSDSWPATAPSTSNVTTSWPYAGIYLARVTVLDTGSGADTRTVTASLSVADTGQGTESRSLTIAPLSISDTATAVELLSRRIPDTGNASETVSISASLTITETGLGNDGLNREGQVTILDNSATVTEVIAAPLQTVTDTGGVDPDTGEVVIAPLFSVTDTATGTDIISRPILDTGAGTDTVTVAVSLPIISDTAQGNETIAVIGNTPTPPSAATTGGLDAKHVLRLIYGNNKRNPLRTLDLAESAEGHIFLQSGGFAPESGELNELWSGASIRFDGQKKLAESRDNSRLSIVYDLASGSQAGLSHLQRKINRFFLEAKIYHTQHRQNERVWLEYRWSDSLARLPRPTFGQLSYYYEIYTAKAPKWPAELHNNMLLTGNVLGVTLEVTGSPAPEGVPQQAGRAGGTITLHDKGILIASGASSQLHWPGYTPSGLTGEFTVTGWFTLNAAWSSGTKDIFDYYVNASNRIRLQYDVGNSRFVITKIVGGTTFTANSSVFAIASGDDVHVQLVQDATTLRLYVNGTQIASVTATATMTDGGLIALGCPAAGTIDGVDVILDGWRILPDDLTSSQAAQVYAAELPVKQDGGQVGPPPYLWTKDNDNTVDNYNDLTRDNWAIIGGVGGDIEAEIEIRVTPTTITAQQRNDKTFWMGVISSYTKSVPDYLISYGGGYSSYSGPNYFGSTGINASDGLMRGRYRVLAYVRTNGNATLRPYYYFNSSFTAYNFGKETKPSASASLSVLDLGTLVISTSGDTQPNVLGWGIEARGASYSIAITAIWLIPEDVKVSQAENGFSNLVYPLIIPNGGVAYVQNNSNYGYEYIFTKTGELRVKPWRYNYLFLSMQHEAGAIDFNDSFLLDAYITPRFILPGGMVG